MAVAATTWWVVNDGGSGDLAVDLPKAVASEPSLDWSWDAPSTIDTITTDGKTTYALTDGSLFALDEEGDELWDVEVDDAEYVGSVDPQSDLISLSGSEDGESLRSTSDGHEVLSTEGDIVGVIDDNAIVSEEDEVRSINLESGKVSWSTELGDYVAVDRDTVLVLDDGRLRRLTQSGEEQWSVDVDVSVDESTDLTIADDFVVINGMDTAVALADDDGHELWSADTSEDGGRVGLMFPDAVYVQKNAFSFDDEESEDTTVVIYDRDGRIASIDPESSFFFAFPVRSGRDVYAFDFGGGVFYDREFERVGRSHDGTVQPVDGGLYELSEGRVRFFRNDDSSSAWTLSDEFGDEAQVSAGDKRLLIADGSDLLSYS